MCPAGGPIQRVVTLAHLSVRDGADEPTKITRVFPTMLWLWWRPVQALHRGLPIKRLATSIGGAEFPLIDAVLGA